MNASFLHLSLKYQVNGGNYFSQYQRNHFQHCKFSYFAISLCLLPKNIDISYSCFSCFLHQVLRKSHNENELTKIRCSSFKNISTMEKGSVFSVSNSNVIVDRCMFSYIQTTQQGACFYANSSNCLIKECTFSSCHALNGEANFGNAYYLEKCNCHVSLSFTIYCAPSDEMCGDSAIAVIYSTGVYLEYLNSSYSYGKSGAALVTYRESSCTNCYISHFTILNSNEYTALEISMTENSYVSYGNFVNTSGCKVIIINNNQVNGIANFTYCFFLNPVQEYLILLNEHIIFSKCYSNNEILCNTYNLSLISEDQTINYSKVFSTPNQCSVVSNYLLNINLRKSISIFFPFFFLVSL